MFISKISDTEGYVIRQIRTNSPDGSFGIVNQPLQEDGTWGGSNPARVPIVDHRITEEQLAEYRMRKAIERQNNV